MTKQIFVKKTYGYSDVIYAGDKVSVYKADVTKNEAVNFALISGLILLSKKDKVSIDGKKQDPYLVLKNIKNDITKKIKEYTNERKNIKSGRDLRELHKKYRY